MAEFDIKIESTVASFLRNYSFPDSLQEVDVSEMTAQDIAQKIEHTLLKSTASPNDIRKLCEEAKESLFRSVCVNPSYVTLASDLLSGTNILVVTVIGFPLGATLTTNKEHEVHTVIQNGANEVDMVIHQGRLRAKEYEYVLYDIKKVVLTAGSTPVKVILETCNLTKEEIVAGCLIAVEAGAEYVKTSTGFGNYGAKIEDVHLMKSVVGKDIGVKASGGIKDKSTVLKMITNGADLIGTSSGLSILKEYKN
jgi:deoxyribose-phosphate aldolase